MDNPFHRLLSKPAQSHNLFFAIGLFCVPFLQPDAGAESLKELQDALVALSDNVRPSVVSITCKREVNSLPNLTDISWSLRGSRATLRKGSPKPRKETRLFETSGIAIDGAGHVVTLASALSLPGRIMVKDLKGKQLAAELVGVDKCANVAVIRTKDGNLPAAPLAGKQKLKVGQWVASIANPFGLQGSVSPGAISGLNRFLESAAFCYPGLIQITNPLRPGEMGGALVNLEGQVIGMLCSSYQDSEAAVGNTTNVSFALPIRLVARSARQLIKTGHVTHGLLGVGVVEPRDGSRGVVVVTINSASPAAKAGINPGDSIVRFNGVDVLKTPQVVALVHALDPGTEVELQMLRGDVQFTRKFALGKAQAIHQLTGREKQPGWLGLRFNDLTTDYRSLFQMKGTGGVIVVEAVSGSPAAVEGISAGEIIVKIANEPVVGVRDCLSRLSNYYPGDVVELIVLRKGVYVPVKVRMSSLPPGSGVSSVDWYSRGSLSRGCEAKMERLSRKLKALEAKVEALQRQLKEASPSKTQP